MMNRVRTFGDHGHPLVGWDGHGLGATYDDGSRLTALGFSLMQATQIINMHDSGALSDVGYQYILNGAVDPENLNAFLENDPGASSGTTVPMPGGVNQQLTPGPSPRVAAPTFNLSTWLAQSTLIGGVSNQTVLLVGIGLVVVPELVAALSGGRRR